MVDEEPKTAVADITLGGVKEYGALGGFATERSGKCVARSFFARDVARVFFLVMRAMRLKHATVRVSPAHGPRTLFEEVQW